MKTTIDLLSNAKSGETVRVKEIRGGGNMRCRLMEMGIIRGTMVRVLANDGGPLMVLVGNSRFAIGQGMAQKVSVDRS